MSPEGPVGARKSLGSPFPRRKQRLSGPEITQPTGQRWGSLFPKPLLRRCTHCLLEAVADHEGQIRASAPAQHTLTLTRPEGERAASLSSSARGHPGS